MAMSLTLCAVNFLSLFLLDHIVNCMHLDSWAKVTLSDLYELIEKYWKYDSQNLSVGIPLIYSSIAEKEDAFTSDSVLNAFSYLDPKIHNVMNGMLREKQYLLFKYKPNNRMQSLWMQSEFKQCYKFWTNKNLNFKNKFDLKYFSSMFSPVSFPLKYAWFLKNIYSLIYRSAYQIFW